ncbi:phosphate ABC transporter substrate-binding protein PstS family protein [Acetobacterium paludosum]|uniref:Phosphate-binding protein n=1 Tax=Acetobacterium paludosum TaxID=52693 RepID=A0A923I450_9FIRM|nr:phosphate ABC transporter substrate-binding protein [Acetobacterium paludosum]MBC3889603.1 phosphate ABC transporter substrate-binding protein PstS family protein [Acetobacterium paludosum]
MKKIFALFMAVVLVGITMTACSTNTKSSTSSTTSEVTGSLTAAGSSALAPLVQVAADNFQQLNPKASVNVSAGGSGTGLTQVANKSIDIGNSDVTAESKLTADQAATLKDHQICAIGVAAVVNSDVTVTNLSKQQLSDIFTGKITNWNQVGGADEAITLISRPESSGTRALFKQYALDNAIESSNTALSSDDSGTLETNIASTKGSIGYLAFSYLVGKYDVKKMSIDGVAPTLENVYNGSYPVWGTEHMYTNGEATGVTKAFLDYMGTDTFQTQMENLGYNVISKMTTAAGKH